MTSSSEALGYKIVQRQSPCFLSSPASCIDEYGVEVFQPGNRSLTRNVVSWAYSLATWTQASTVRVCADTGSQCGLCSSYNQSALQQGGVTTPNGLARVRYQNNRVEVLGTASNTGLPM